MIKCTHSVSFSSKASGSDIVGMDLVKTKSHNGATEGNVSFQFTFYLKFHNVAKLWDDVKGEYNSTLQVPGKSPNSHVWVETNEQQYLASRTGALLTAKMKGAAESYIGRSVVNGAVIIPSYFSNMQRQAVNAVGRIAGFSTVSGTVEVIKSSCHDKLILSICHDYFIMIKRQSPLIFLTYIFLQDAPMQSVVNPKKNINRPLSPHLSIYEPQLTSTYSIFNRISGGFLTAVLLSGLLFVLQIGPLSLTYPSLYLSSFAVDFPKLTLSLFNFTLLAFCYHIGNGLRHIWWDLGFPLDSFRGIRISEFLMLCIAFSAFAKIIQKLYFWGTGCSEWQ